MKIKNLYVIRDKADNITIPGITVFNAQGCARVVLPDTKKICAVKLLNEKEGIAWTCLNKEERQSLRKVKLKLTSLTQVLKNDFTRAQRKNIKELASTLKTVPKHIKRMEATYGKQSKPSKHTAPDTAVDGCINGEVKQIR